MRKNQGPTLEGRKRPTHSEFAPTCANCATCRGPGRPAGQRLETGASCSDSGPEETSTEILTPPRQSRSPDSIGRRRCEGVWRPCGHFENAGEIGGAPRPARDSRPWPPGPRATRARAELNATKVSSNVSFRTG
ncbi:hypothetical protein AKJ09_01088 [Labilithrix luteola]|uniref:Uncharacterized protein n=1 Tax=Labilithrix luteola TaxID=1391654 RepID=A0A0K1PMT4_9BACT|nr:hypothetical protein AKJ09_01088 [Labilithrix luteola]